MTPRARTRSVSVVAIVAMLSVTTLVFAGGHTWRIGEIFTNADGTIQYIEVAEVFGLNNEIGTNNKMVTSNTKSFTITGNVTTPTGHRKILIATPGYAALPGVPTPNFVLPAASVPFFSPAGDRIRLTGLDDWMIPAGTIPTDGVHSLRRPFTSPPTPGAALVECNSPENYARVVGFINVGCSMAGDVDGSGNVDGGDVAAFVRVITGAPDMDDNEACAEYCEDTLADTIAAFVADLLA